ncbi:MAG: electron transport complex subunit RsxA [Lachnospiraceae bacterium]|nr:electron transport complex subunit RsxA [Lachnospiraceae bacterium]
MKEMLQIVLAAALVENVVLSQFLGLCPFLGVSKKVKTAASMGAAVILVITVSSAVTSLIYQYILAANGLEFLETIVFILVIAALVQLVEMFLKKSSPALYQALGVYLPLITTNCAVLGVALTNVQENYNVLYSTLNGFGTAVGFTIAIVIMAGIREKLEDCDVPKAFQGTPIVLITAGLMAMAFIGFSGLF